MINYQLYICDPTKYMKHVQGVTDRGLQRKCFSNCALMIKTLFMIEALYHN